MNSRPLLFGARQNDGEEEEREPKEREPGGEAEDEEELWGEAGEEDERESSKKSVNCGGTGVGGGQTRPAVAWV